MAASDTQFTAFIAEEIKKYGDTSVPVKATFIERLLVKKVNCSRLHPNPDDEFCLPSVGPNYGIIAEYMKKISRYDSLLTTGADEPLVVTKIRPDGYMLLNGHHRWAAALRLGFDPVPIKIINLVQETDIRKLLRTSKHDKRVTLDLDEIVFCHGEDDLAEAPLPFPYNRMFKERMRYGIPAILHYLTVRGYDIWVYTANYYSIEHISLFFSKYSSKINVVINGTARKYRYVTEMRARLAQPLKEKYTETLHIDRRAVLRTFRDSEKYEEYPLDAKGAEWSQKVMEILKGME